MFNCASIATNFDSIGLFWKIVFQIFLPVHAFFSCKIDFLFSLCKLRNRRWFLRESEIGIFIMATHRHTLTPSGRYLTRRADSLTSLIFNVAACADFGYFLPRSNLAFSGFKGSAICRSYCCIFQIFKISTESVKNDVLKN